MATIPVGYAPISMTCNPARNRVYVANQYSSTISVILNPNGGVEETPVAEARRPNAGPTIVRGVLTVGDRDRRAGDRLALLDVSGRRAMELYAGPNDVRGLASGVYFVRRQAGGVDDLRKVILQ